MAESGNIYKLLAQVAAKLPAVPKSEEVDTGRERYSYRGIANIIDVVHGPLAEAGIVVVPEVLDVLRCLPGQTRSGTPNLHLIVRYAHTFFAPDGSSVRAVTLGEGVDTSDKAANKCHSAALKYALNEVLLLAYGVEEQDAERPELPNLDWDRKTPATTPSKPAAKPAAKRPAAQRPGAPQPEDVPACPECGKAMRLRSGKQGDFWGCPGYPQCRGTRNVLPGTPTQPNAIGADGAERLTAALKDHCVAYAGDARAIRDRLYGLFDVDAFAKMTPEQEEEALDILRNPPRPPEGEL